MEGTIKKEMLTELMNDRDSICEKINKLISPDKALQAHKGVRLDGIHITSEGCWSAVIFPQWVKCEPSHVKSYRFSCTENGEFIGWSN